MRPGQVPPDSQPDKSEPDAADWANARDAVKILSAKWSLPVFHSLWRAPRRHRDIARDLYPVTGKVLTDTLARLKRRKLITSEDVDGHNVYSLTAAGRAIPIAILSQWFRDSRDQPP